MSDELKILIQGQLDTSKKSIDQINDQLKEIEGKVDKINIGINTEDIKNLQQSIKQIQSSTGKGVKVVDEESVKNLKGIEDNLDDVVKRYKELGSVKVNKTLDPLSKEAREFTIELERANGIIERIRYEGLKVAKNNGDIDYIYRLKDVKEINDQMKKREQLLQQEHQTRQKISNQEQQETERLEHQLRLFKERAKIDAQNLNRRYDGKFDDTALNNWLKNVDQLNNKTPKLRQEMDMLGVEFKKIGSEVRTSNSHVLGFGEALSTALERFPIWMAAATAFYAPLRALQNMTQQVIELDTALTSLSRVTDMNDSELSTFLEDSIKLSDELSNRLSDVIKIAEEFSRLGFEDAELLDMTKTAQVLQNISDLDATQTVDALTSAMLNFNIAGEESIRIADSLNEVDNNFAVTTKTLATGLQRSSSTAKTFGVEMESLLGYITAIGSTTRESGSQIGKLLLI